VGAERLPSVRNSVPSTSSATKRMHVRLFASAAEQTYSATLRAV
jgi:hypothetical protein